MNCPKVSIIIPVYNNEEYVERCIRSVMNQTLRDIEIIVIDDGSTDSAPEIIDNLASEDTRIKVIHKANEGVAVGENLGLDIARGEYVGFVEADDRAVADMYELLYNCAVSTDADVVKSGFFYCEKDKMHEFTAFYQLANEDEVFQAKDRPNIFMYHASMWAGIYKRSFIESNKIRNIETPKASYTDFTWSTMVYAYAKKIAVVHKALYLYTYDNPASSRVQEDEKCFYMPFHCLKANQILRDTKIFDQVKEEIGYQEYTACFGHAKRIRSDLRDEYFKRFRNVMMDLDKESLEYKKFFFIDNYMAKLILQDKEKAFYNWTDLNKAVLDNRYVKSVWWFVKGLKFKIIH